MIELDYFVQGFCCAVDINDPVNLSSEQKQKVLDFCLQFIVKDAHKREKFCEELYSKINLKN